MNNKILIMNVNWVGDVIFSTPFIRAVRAANQKSHIACLVHPRCKDMLLGSPYLDEIIIYDEEQSHNGILGKLRFIFSLRSKHFDTVYILHRSFTRALLAFAAGIKNRVGYATKHRGVFLTNPIPEPKTKMHKVEYFLNILKCEGIKADDPTYDMFISDEECASAREILTSLGLKYDEPYMVICPGGNWEPKRWPADRFARLADIVWNEFKIKIVITCSKNDAAIADDVEGRMKSRAINVSGRTSLKELAGILKRAKLVIANDSGPMHMSVAMGTETIALFGPTSPALTGPYGRGKYHVLSKMTECAVPCYNSKCRKYSCMEAIRVEDVADIARKILTKRDF